MKPRQWHAIWVGLALLFLATGGHSAQAPAGPQANPPPPQQSAPTPPAPSAATAMKVETRLITVDVVATDSHGHPVRDLKQEDFQVFDQHGGDQKIARFAFIDGASSTTAAAGQPGALPIGPHIYSNLEGARLTAPPTAILMDALNTEITKQVEVHRHMLMLLKTLPANTPIAVFILGHTLHVVQGFTTDPGLLKAAVDQALKPLSIEQNPQDDPDSAANTVLNENGGTETSETQALEDFEKEEYEAQMSIRVDETTDAMAEIAKYLGGYTGRKNLIWFSGSFPIWIAPTSDFGGNPALGISPSTTKIPGQEFGGAADYSDKVRAAAEALTDARVAVYPVDASGLEASNLYSVAQNPQINQVNPGAGFGNQLAREDNTRSDAQATMKEISESTGGRTCTNTNDLAGCVQEALDDSSSYYELSYYPENIKWDGHFQKITVKTQRHGVRLAYRRGYFATASQGGNQGTPEALLQQTCSDPLPSTGINMTVEPVAPRQTPGQPPEPRYLLAVSPSALSIAPVGATRQLNLRMAICEYDPKGDRFGFFQRDISRPVTDAALKSWQQNGIRSLFDYNARPENLRLRFAVLDVSSGTTGSVDVPAHPRDFGTIPGAPAQGSGPAGTPASQISQAVAPLPGAPAGPAAPPQQAMVTTTLTFRSSSGKVSKLDWSEGKVTYQGDLGVELGASGFFQKFFAVQYHCQAGALVSNDPKATAAPRLALVLRGASGPGVLIDFTGSEPQYTGDLPVDPDAKAFFAQVWKLCHCQAP
ncbi:MAG: VWA domain-containing protein [Candidatus Acidiferrales bacterium]